MSGMVISTLVTLVPIVDCSVAVGHVEMSEVCILKHIILLHIHASTCTYIAFFSILRILDECSLLWQARVNPPSGILYTSLLLTQL